MCVLKPCVMPSCGSYNVELKTSFNCDIYEPDDNYYIFCNDCQLITDEYSDVEKLINDWNKRQPHPAILEVYEDYKNSNPNTTMKDYSGLFLNAIKKAVEE
jgi:hypothetical protein